MATGNGASFQIDVLALFLLLLFGVFIYVLHRFQKGYERPFLLFSDLQNLARKEPSLKTRWADIPLGFKYAALILFGLAFLDPHFYVAKEEKQKPPLKQVGTPSEGIAIYLVLDQSGSMAQEVSYLSPEGRRMTLSKMELLKRVTRDFVNGNPNMGLQGRGSDMLGLLTFARGAQVQSPLTLDHRAILEKLARLEYVTAREEDGTSIGYAIFKAANLIAATRHYAEDLAGAGKPAYEIKSSVMILVTDGLQSPSPLDKGKRLRNIDLIEAAHYAKKQGIKVYIVNVEPRLASKEFAAHRNLMKQVAGITEGKFYLVEDSSSLGRIYAEIDRLEKSTLPVETKFVTPPKGLSPHLWRRVSLYPYLIAAALVALLTAVVLETQVLRRVP